MSWADETKALTPQIPHRDIWYKSILWFPFFPKYFSTYQPKTHIYKGCSAIPGTGCNNSFQLQAMYPGTKWIRLEGKRARQLQMCSSLVTSKSNFSSLMGSPCLTLPAAHQKWSQAQKQHSQSKWDGSCVSKNLQISAPRCRGAWTWQVLCLSKQLCYFCQAHEQDYTRGFRHSWKRQLVQKESPCSWEM